MIGSPVTIGPVTHGDRGDKTSLLHRSTTALVPVGTRSLLVVVTQTGTGLDNDGYADNLSLVFTPPHAIFLPLVRK